MKNASTSEIFKYDRLYAHSQDYGITSVDEPRFAVTMNCLNSIKGLDSVLDAGVGRGGFYSIARSRYNVFGIEPSQAAINKFHAGDDRIKNIFIQELPNHYPANTFDAVVCLDVLEHIPEQDIQGCFEAFLRVGKKYFIMSIAHHEDVIDGMDLHITDLPYSEWEEKLSALFTITQVTSIHDDKARVYLLERKQAIIYPPEMYPQYLAIRLTSKCNLHCCFCDRASVKVTDFDFNNIRKLDNSIRYAKTIDLTGVGEPFMYPYFNEALDYIYSLNPSHSLINITSNGSMLSFQKAQKLNGHLNQFVISLNAASESTYQRDIKNGNFTRTLASVADFMSGLGADERKKVDLHFVAHADNFMEIADFVALADSLGIKSVSVWPMLVTASEQFPKTLLSVRKEYSAVITYAKILANKLGVTLSARSFGCETIGSYASCHQPFNVCVVNEDGTVSPCCNAGELRMGSIKDSDFESIWFGKLYQDFRNNREQVVCRRCTSFYPLDTINSYLQAQFYESIENKS